MDIDIAVDALKDVTEQNEAINWTIERMLPKSVIYESDGDADGYPVYDMAECPACPQLFEDGDDTWKYAQYCPRCGQRLSWEVEPEE